MKMTTDIEQNSTGDFGDSVATVQPPPSEGDFTDVSTTDEEAQNVHGQLTKAGNVVDNPQDGDDAVHDQLPTVDQYKADMAFNKEDGSPKKSRAGLYTFLGLFLVTVIVTAIAVPLAMKNEEGAKSSSGAVTQNTDHGSYSHSDFIMTATPHLSPTRAPVVAPVVPEKSRLQKTRAYLETYNIADREILSDPTSPQAMATKWIADDDKFAMEIPSSPTGFSYVDTRFIDRWTLAVLYFSTGGEFWKYETNFMKPIDHCKWNEFYSNGAGGVVSLGVTKCVNAVDGERVQRIELTNNGLIGVIPLEIQYLVNLEAWLSAFNPDLVGSGSLEPFLAMADHLSHLELQYSGLTGTIPDSLSDLKKLEFLGLGNNMLTGDIPESFFSLTNLKVLGLDDNLLQAPIALFANFTNIQRLYLEDNLISGEITQEMLSGGWQNIVDLDASGNRLDGPLPPNIWSLKNLEVVDLHGNDFIGQIPEIKAVNEKITFLALQDNSLEWRIPESINNLVNLKHLDISANKMTIPFPSTMNQMTNLVALYTGINGFNEHPIPDFLWSLTNLREISMKQSKLSGEIPSNFGLLTDLQVLDLDLNHLEGSIPSEIGLLTGLDTLLLNRNFLNGTIPESFSNLVDMDVLLLDGNSITGSADPICKANMTLTFFSSDCDDSDEVTCSCCTLCCNDNNSTCNNKDWRVNLDGIWEYDFQRLVYSFSQELLPTSAKDTYTTSNPDEAEYVPVDVKPQEEGSNAKGNTQEEETFTTSNPDEAEYEQVESQEESNAKGNT